MNLLNEDNQIALVALSNGLGREMKEKIEALCSILRQMQLSPVCSQYLYQQETVRGGAAKEKARELEKYYADEQIKAVFDVSGGDIANEVLCELDFERLAAYRKPFWGYSDLTTILNALYQKTGEAGCLYQIRNLVGSYHEEQQRNFTASMLQGKNDLFEFQYQFVQGSQMSGVVVGGNIRCLLKLAGTGFMPDFKDKILLLESRSGTVAQMITFLAQYKQLGVFDRVSGILLGSFTQMEQEKLSPTIETLVIEMIGNENLPVARTSEIGHGQDAKAIWIGKPIKLCK